MKPIYGLLFLLFLATAVVAQNAKPKVAKLYPHLKAVLVVGNVQDHTEHSIQSMNRVAKFLREKGVNVYCFYDTAANWNKIRVAATGAHFFIYNGHGSRGGGLNIHSGGTSHDIEELHLSKNAFVGFQSVCYGAGSTASDTGTVSQTEALNRVNWYAAPFLKAGAGCYLANNINDGVLGFLYLFFKGENAKQCFQTSIKSSWAKLETIQPYKNDHTKEIGVASTNWGGTITRTSWKNGVKTVKEVPNYKSFEIAFVGNPAFVIKDFVK